MKRFLLLFLVLVLFTGTAAAEEAEIFTSGDFEYTILEDGTVCVNHYFGDASELTIPAELDGKPVTAIGDNAFTYCESLTTITIPDSVASIGDEAFSYCDGLTAVTISGGVISIGDSAFYSCYNLTTVTIQDGIIAIGERAFDSCKNLTAIKIPDSVTSIGDDAFAGCDSLTLTVGRDSYAAQYCKDNELHYQYADALDWLNE